MADEGLGYHMYSKKKISENISELYEELIVILSQGQTKTMSKSKNLGISATFHGMGISGGKQETDSMTFQGPDKPDVKRYHYQKVKTTTTEYEVTNWVGGTQNTRKVTEVTKTKMDDFHSIDKEKKISV
eukprot:214668_1